MLPVAASTVLSMARLTLTLTALLLTALAQDWEAFQLVVASEVNARVNGLRG